MSYCFNPACSQPLNQVDNALCSSCGSNIHLQDRYYATKIIGQGGFGKTYLAVDKENSNPCVIKQFSFPSSSSTALRLFSDEAQQLQSLGVHEQIPTFIDYVEQQDECFIVQEFVDGNNLEEELTANGAFSEAQIEQLLLDILPVIEFVHKQGVIHRDIKPENIIRRKSDQRFILVDFGAAKQATTTALAKTGTTIGSAGYTAPEQAFGKAVKQSDLYSLGVTSIHLLTGMHPFDLVDSSDGNWVWRDYLKRPVSQRLSKIIDKLLERGTKMRYASAAEVLRELKTNSRLQVIESSVSTKVRIWKENNIVIPFCHTNETIKETWLDNSLMMALDINEVERIIYLQPIESGFKSEFSQTTLTVITEQRDTKIKKNYQFLFIASSWSHITDGKLTIYKTSSGNFTTLDKNRKLIGKVKQKVVKKSTLRFPTFGETVAGLVTFGLISGAAFMINEINSALNSPTSEKATQVLTSMQNTKFMPVQTVEVWDEPISISFDKNKEIIAKVQVDDPTKISLVLDEDTQVIKLQKVSKAFKPKDATNLTVITQSISKEKFQHRIKVIAGSGKPKYKKVAIIDGLVEIESVAVSPQLPEKQKNDLQETDKAFLLLLNVSQVLGFLIILLGVFKSVKSNADGEASQSGVVLIVFGIISMTLISGLAPQVTDSLSSVNEQVQQADN